VRHGYKLGVPTGGFWREILNTDSEQFDGGNVGNFGGVHATNEPWMNRPHSVTITLPPLAMVVLRAV
jgi:1,4-alpha-glucan branching enzyme